MFNNKKYILSLSVITILTTGCSQTTKGLDTNGDNKVKTKSMDNNTISQKTMNSDGSFILPNAKAGVCYGKVIIPEKYKIVTEKILSTPKSEQISVIPAEYKTGIEKVVDIPATTKIITIPATYKTVNKTVTVSPAYTEWRTGLEPDARVASSALLDSAKRHGIDLDKTPAGSCYYEFYMAPQYKSTTEKVLDTAASSKIIAQPPVITMGTKKVLITPATTKIVTIPATYKTVTEKIKVAPAKKVWKETKCHDKDCSVEDMMCLVDVPAQYKTVTKQVVVKPATTKTVTIPAVYKTVKVNKLASEAKTKTINIPATYKTITKTQKVSDAKYTWSNSLAEKPGMTRTNSVICKVSVPAVVKNITKQIVANPSKTKTVTIPATYKTIKVTKIVHPEKTKKIVIPATYKNITKKVLVSPQQVKWMPVLCKSSMTIDTISKIQQALTNAGFETPVTGTLDSATKKSVKEYQAKKGLTISGLTIETIKSLGVF